MAVANGPAGLVLAGPVFMVIFGTAHAQIMKFSHLCSCNRARTTPWLQRMNDQDPRKATSSVNYKFSKRTFGQKKAVSMPSNLLGLASGSGNDFTSWLST